MTPRSPRGAESQLPVEPVVDLFGLALNLFQFRDEVGVLGRVLKPLGIFFVYHGDHIPFFCARLPARFLRVYLKIP